MNGIPFESRPLPLLRGTERGAEYQNPESPQAIGQGVAGKRVFDPVLRTLHAWNALLVVGLLVTAELSQWFGYSARGEFLWRLHVWLGMALILGLIARVTWGVVGPRYARFSDLWHPREWACAARTGRWFTPPRRFGHHAQASAAYLALYLLLLVMGISGLVLAALEQNMGPLVPWIDFRVEYLWLFKTPHLFVEKLIMIYIVLHLGAVFLHHRLHGVQIAQSMYNGYQFHRVDRW
ncbi:MAG: hypothetical protein Kow006_02280 [Gammaproteobacteria bacterium]